MFSELTQTLDECCDTSAAEQMATKADSHEILVLMEDVTLESP